MRYAHGVRLSFISFLPSSFRCRRCALCRSDEPRSIMTATATATATVDSVGDFARTRLGDEELTAVEIATADARHTPVDAALREKRAVWDAGPSISYEPRSQRPRSTPRAEAAELQTAQAAQEAERQANRREKRRTAHQREWDTDMHWNSDANGSGGW